MKKLLFIFSFIFILTQLTEAYQNQSSRLSLRDPQTFNGTYRLERFILREKDRTLIDSDNEFQVHDDKGIATIVLKMSKSQIQVELIYKMEMVGPAFEQDDFKNYQFIFKNKIFTRDIQKFESVSAALQSMGAMVYGSHELIWQLPFEKGKTVTLKLNKRRDMAVPLDNIPFSERKKMRNKHKQNEYNESKDDQL